jgi:SAM-dependent methyltransferase
MTTKDPAPPDYTDPVLKEYRRLAPDYDERWSSYIATSLEQTLRRLELRPGERILDVGCGTGALLSLLSESAPTVQLSGVDPVPEMLEIARQRLGNDVVLEQAFAEGLPFSSQKFDVVISTNAFHYFRKPVVALEEMVRVLNKGGRVVITDWCGDYVTCRICDLLLRVFSQAHFRIYGEKLYRSLFQQAGFTKVQIDCYKIDWFWGLMTAVAERPAIYHGSCGR